MSLSANTLTAEDLAYSDVLCYSVMLWSGYQIWRHTQLIGDALNKIESREIRRLLITVPPRHGKTILTGENFTTWYIGRHPTHQAMYATYSGEKAEDHGLRAKQYMESDEYGIVFPECRLSADSKSKSKLTTTKGGNIFYVGVGGAIVGRGANCVVGETEIVILINNQIRIIDIASLYLLKNHKEIKVLSLDLNQNKTVFKRIVAIREEFSNEIYEIKTNSGNHIRTTGEHRFFVPGQGYINAKDLRKGCKLTKSKITEQQNLYKLRKTKKRKGPILQSMLRRAPQSRDKSDMRMVWKDDNQESLRNKKSNKKRTQRPILFYRMFNATPCNKKQKKMCPMWKTNPEENSEILFRTMQTKCKRHYKTKAYKMSNLWRIFSANKQQTTILQPRVCKQSSFASDAWERQLPLQEWNELYNSISKDEALHFKTRRCQVCDMQQIYGAKESLQERVVQPTNKKQFSCAPHRRRPDKQYTGKLDSAMYDLPCDTSQIEQDTISSIKKISSSKIPVYDIQVEGTSNFFANEILVHNCFIMDDLVKSREEAESPATKRRILNWYKGSVYERLMGDAVIVFITCVAEGERILMGDGTWKNIENVSIGDHVIGYDNQRPVKKEVLNAKCSGEDDILEVISRSCSVKVNKRHPFLVIKGGLQHTALTQVDVIASKKWELEWVPAGELVQGDMVVTIKSMQPQHGTKPLDIYHQKQKTNDDFWLLGFLFGDGWLINNNKRGVVGFCVSTSDKPNLDLKVKTLLKERFGANMKQTKFGYARCDCQSIGRWLHSEGLRSGAHTKRLPKWLFKVRRSFKKQFLRGFFAADGYEKPKGSFHVHICNKDLLDDMRLLARTCGIKTTKIYTQSYKSKPPNSPKAFIATSHLARFYEKSNKIELKGRYRFQGDLGRYFRLEKIESVTPVGKSRVYDLTVDGAESFIAEGFVVHNTRWAKDDLAGELLASGNEWVHLKLEAVCTDKEKDPLHREIGEPLCPELFDKPALDDIKNVIGTREWFAQYQSNPIDEEGGIIKYKWFKYYDETPKKFDRIIQSWDTAFSKKDINSPSVCLTFGQKGKDHYWLDTYRAHIDYPTLKKRVRELSELWSPMLVLIEDRASGQSIKQDIVSEQGEFKVDVPIRSIYPKGSKIQRMSTQTSPIETGHVLLPAVAPWLADTIAELIPFPNVKFKDIADALSQYLKFSRKALFQSNPNLFWK